MIGLRFEVGGDWFNYIEIYEEVRFLNFASALFLERSDPGYSLLNWIGHQLGVGIWLVNLVCGFLLMWGLIKFAADQPEPWLVLLLAVPYLIIVVGMGYTRQAAAIGFVLAALSAFSNRRLGVFAVYMVLAATFHKSAIIIIPIAGLAVTNNRFLTTLLFGIIAVILYFTFLASRISMLSENYLQAQLESEGATVRILMNVIPAVIYLLTQHKYGFSEGARKLWRNMSIAAIISGLALLVLPSSTAVDRLSLYLVPMQILVFARLPDVFVHNGRRNSFVLGGVIAYAATVQFVWLNLATHSMFWVPYQIYPFGFDEQSLY
jgi:hypothetical protein